MIRMLRSYALKPHGYFSYEVFVLSALLLFALLVGNNKWFANGIYIACLLPGAYFLFKKDNCLKPFYNVFLRLFVYCFYISVVLLADGLNFKAVKYFLLLILFFYFICYGVFFKSQVLSVYAVMLVICTIFMAYAIWDAGALVVGRYDFSGLNANRLSLLFIMPSAWFLWHAFAEDKKYKFGFVFLFVLSFFADFYLLGSRTLLFFVIVYLAFFIYEFKNELNLQGLICLLAIGFFSLLIVAGFYELFYEKVVVRGSSYRFDIWQDALDRIRAESCYLYGCGKQDGYKFLGEFDNPHGFYSSALYYYGIFGAVLLFSFLGACFYELKGFYRAWFAACLAYFVFTHVEPMGSPSVFWLYFWLPLFIGFLDKRDVCNE